MILGRTLESWYASYPLIRDLVALQETTWFNPGVAPVAQAIADPGLTSADVADASTRLSRFASYLRRAFPETECSAGIIESDIVPLAQLQPLLAQRYGHPLNGALWLKRDSHLPISGSIKARGGIYEVLKHAEDLALAGGLLTLNDDYALLHSDKARAFFGQYKIAVGSTGNLGMSIGIMGAALGFQVTVHMSADARQFLSMMEKPDVDTIEGLSPAISIEQKSTSHNPRSTVGTITEIYDYLRLLYARVGIPRCPDHDIPLEAQTVSQMVDLVLAQPEGAKLMLLAVSVLVFFLGV